MTDENILIRWKYEILTKTISKYKNCQRLHKNKQHQQQTIESIQLTIKRVRP